MYISTAEALEMLEESATRQCCPSMGGVKDASERMDAMREPMSEAETEVATELVRGRKFVEVPGV